MICAKHFRMISLLKKPGYWKRQEVKVISKEANKPHEKHAKLVRPVAGEFGRNELAILGTTCANIRKLAYRIIDRLSASHKIAYVDADHKKAGAEAESAIEESALAHGASIEFTDKINFRRFDHTIEFNAYQKRTLFNNQDLVLINGNHFIGRSQ